MERSYTRRTLIEVFGGAMVATGFALATGRWSGGAASAQTTAAGTPVTGPGPGAPLLRVEYTGGFVPVEYSLTAMPVFSMYPDGRVIMTGPMTEIYPQAALPNLRVMRLTAKGIDRVLAEARAAGLFDGSESYSLDNIADAQSAVFSLNADGVSTTVSAYALGMDEPAFGDPSEAEARAKLSMLLDFLVFGLSTELAVDEIASGDEPLVSEAVRIFARPIDPKSPPWQDVVPAPTAIEWPLTTSLVESGEVVQGPYGEGTRCVALSGKDAVTVLRALAGASQITPWSSEGMLFQLWVRPLLPDESGCV